ncbi:MAG: rRNA maturation RNase YbeY [Betaproteobacteria bacterium]|nr:rRNA maturation RNase YbeY [Betaproteobacteria bacterium]
MMSLAVQYVARDVAAENLPKRARFRAWAKAALPEGCRSEITIRLVSAEEGQKLNLQYRGKDYPTNVLSFPYMVIPQNHNALSTAPCRATSTACGSSLRPGMLENNYSLPPEIAGDLAICPAVVEREAAAQQKPLAAHYAHLTVHGLLHLQGYNHENVAEAEIMEAREREILDKLGFPDYSAESS